MARRQLILTGVAAAMGMAALIIDTNTALIGGQKGIELCLITVIPSLFPFILLSILLTEVWLNADPPIFRILSRIFRTPSESGSLLAVGMIGGYPVGAQCVGAASQQGRLGASDSRRMLAFCNNCGPAFLFGMTGRLFSGIGYAWALWGIHLLSAWLVSAFIPSTPNHRCNRSKMTGSSIPQTMNRAIRVMASVCGWVVAFRVLIEYLQQWVFSYWDPVWRVSLCGMLELSNGCIALSDICNEGTRFILCAAMLGFGGLCVTLQTYGVIPQTIDRRMYFPGKLLQGCISAILAGFLQLFFSPAQVSEAAWYWLCIPAAGIVMILRKMQKNSSIHERIIV